MVIVHIKCCYWGSEGAVYGSVMFLQYTILPSIFLIVRLNLEMLTDHDVKIYSKILIVHLKLEMLTDHDKNIHSNVFK